MLVEPIPYLNPQILFSQLADESWSMILDSGDGNYPGGRYCFAGADPFIKLTSKNGKLSLNNKISSGNPFAILKQLFTQYTLLHQPNLPPFQTGAMGYFAYDLVQHLEAVDLSWDELQTPDLMLGFYDVIVASDLVMKKSWIISSGLPETEEKLRGKRAQLRARWLNEKLTKVTSSLDPLALNGFKFSANFTQEDYQQQLRRVIDYIYAGDIFQANISQRFASNLPAELSAQQIYSSLRAYNKSPFAAFLNFDGIQLISMSPERFLQLQQAMIETKPIKGTTARGINSEEDAMLKQQLLNSAKDRSENIMIVDLMRNDLSRVCEPHSVKVSKLCEIETYPSVHHLVSTVTGKLAQQFHAVDLLEASFPGGSITGAPKVRAMEIINEIEPTRRGPFYGCAGYIGFDGNMDTSILIRTLVAKDQKIFFQVGGGITADSSPSLEYEETLIKARFVGNGVLKG